jgi:hypothetical protein
MRCQEKTDNALPQEKKPKPKKKVEPSRNDRIVKDLKKKVASLKNSVSRLETHVLLLKRKNKTRGMQIYGEARWVHPHHAHRLSGWMAPR